jgi:hypothetical protein
VVVASMYEDGDSETESDNNSTNNNCDHEEVDAIEIFTGKGGNEMDEKNRYVSKVSRRRCQLISSDNKTKLS